jgi:hypothetical protein
VKFFLLWAALQAGAEIPGRAPVRIGQIRIESVDVFSTEEAAKGWFYRAANRVHVETRKSFLRKQLLFREGDPLDVARLAETERNLRALPFIKTATVTASPPRDGVSDVLVVTQDTWTTQPGISYGSKGGRTTYSFEFQEKDLLGLGKSISFAYDRGSERTTRSILYEDPYLFRPFWKGKLLYADNSDGRQRGLELGRPFYSYLAPWSADLLLDHTAFREKLYENASVVSEFRQEHRERVISYGRALTASEDFARRLTAGYDSVDDEFSPVLKEPSLVIPGRREFRYLFLAYESVGNSFVTLNYVNQFSRDEDFNLAPRLFVRGAVSPRSLGAAADSGFVEVEGSGGMLFQEGSFAVADLDYRTRLQGGVQNEILSAFVGYVRRFSTDTPQTLVGRVQFDRGWDLDGDVQFAADGGTGLRAYRLHSFTGDKRFLFNVEYRAFSEREILQLVSPGAAVFFDSGAAVPRGDPIGLKDLKSDIGVGLRLGITRAGSNSVLRIDVAYAFNRDPRGRRGLLVSFASAQAFNFKREPPSER